MKVVIDKDEIWPYYSPRTYDTDNENPIEVPDELIKEYNEVEEKVRIIQAKLKKYWKDSSTSRIN